MTGRYKLRLADGTVLLVDHDGLSTWLVDRKAMVQLVGTSRWSPLRQFLARERRAARQAERQESAERAALPLVYPEPRGDGATPAPPVPEPGVVDPEPMGTPAGIQALADDPMTPDTPAPLSLPQDAEDPIVPSAPPAEPLLLSPPPESPVPPAPPVGEPAGIQTRADDPGAPVATPVLRASTPEPDAREAVPVPVAEPQPPGEMASPPAVLPPTPPTIVPPTPPIRETVVQARTRTLTQANGPVDPGTEDAPRPDAPQAEDPVASLKQLAEQELPGGPLAAPSAASAPTPLGEPARIRAFAHAPVVVDRGSSPRSATPDTQASAIPLRELAEDAFGEATPQGMESGPSPVGQSTGPQAFADDPGPAGDHSASLSPTPDDSLPVVPLKLIDDEESGGGVEEDAGGAIGLVERALRPGGPGNALLRALAVLGTLLSRLLDPLSRLEAEWPSRPAVALPTWRPQLSLDAVRERATAWIGGVHATISGLLRRERAEASASADEPVPSRPADPASPASVPEAPALGEPARRQRLEPPPPPTELPTLRFAETTEPEPAADVFEGDDGSVGERLAHGAWVWTRRLVFSSGVVAGGVFAAHTWESWLPKAGELGHSMFVEIDEQVRARELGERQRHAVERTAGALPHLAPETVLLVMDDSPAGVLGTPEVFEAAYEAADRGVSALTPADAQELRQLQRSLLDTLSPTERERIREYDRARARGVVFPFEHRVVLALFARGARALPPTSRERLQALTGKAVAAGLALPDLDDPTIRAGR